MGGTVAVLGPGDEVIPPSFTFVWSSNAVSKADAVRLPISAALAGLDCDDGVTACPKAIEQMAAHA